MEEFVKSQIKNLVNSTIEQKLNKYASESEYKPFFEAIFEKQTIIKASIMQSLYTSFGMSIYEQIAVILAQNAGYQATRQYDLRGSIDNHTESLITRICADLARQPHKKSEIEMIRESIQQDEPKLDPEQRVDVFIIKPNGEELYIDITTV
ncbi:MAG TPA: TdeIII family type II restriction endonuclease, partial [Phormidium sp.]